MFFRIVLSSVIALMTLHTSAQGNLQFNQARIITAADGVQAVPSGKVWKVMSVYGAASTTVACWILPPFCVNSSWPNASVGNIRGKGFKVNGSVVWQSVDLSQSLIYYQNPDCTGATTATSGQTNCLSAINIQYPNQSFDELAVSLPFWVPAGVTLEALGTATNISLIEFNVIP
jgi:hypothetical protein